MRKWIRFLTNKERMELERCARVLESMGLPRHAMRMTRYKTLEAEVEKAYARYRKLTAKLDAWEAENPEAAKLVPWRQARDEWIAAGRPDPEWWELLWLMQAKGLPVKQKELSRDLYYYEFGRLQKVSKARRRARERAGR